MITFIFVTDQLHKIMRRDVFQAIADPVRRDIIGLLANETLTVNTVAENFDISRPAISKHIKILKECGIIVINKKGRERYLEIQPKNLMPVSDWIEQYRKLWEEKLDSFEDYLMKLQTKNKKDESDR
ncbi:metalloregulator ArsR/SmtB family transcription factor [Fulvivirgaceae bacterium BMA12]|uniref:Metalloregulator ArsR/SmtB family transcription factor n=1 Tax=Agaribacillus aureus TaxID=3051825 RepID=A0ABT8LFN3_9BACT|nr:metalloregulator ArsR/SmtB family transcription factor [Fulvivirgaceae bacterium BMA12]